MKPIFQVLVSEYYRRNTLFFGLLLIVFAVVMRPAYLIFSPMIIRPILENPPVLAAVVGGCTLYVAKCLIETLAVLRLPENRFIYMLAVQSRVQVFGTYISRLFSYCCSCYPLFASPYGICYHLGILANYFPTLLLLINPQFVYSLPHLSHYSPQDVRPFFPPVPTD